MCCHLYTYTMGADILCQAGLTRAYIIVDSTPSAKEA